MPKQGKQWRAYRRPFHLTLLSLSLSLSLSFAPVSEDRGLEEKKEGVCEVKRKRKERIKEERVKEERGRFRLIALCLFFYRLPFSFFGHYRTPFIPHCRWGMILKGKKRKRNLKYRQKKNKSRNDDIGKDQGVKTRYPSILGYSRTPREEGKKEGKIKRNKKYTVLPISIICSFPNVDSRV
ncbi:uncharacterized protein P884DRAFT_256176 [Thermothelomyces heterothallicus CBS 202.75]|uniref:uncharacterized protein n=1 Tax=Thermothelomyces heterothallicus CBS 202.75 TaxID=1149848 RepID=UPI0037438FF2